MLGLATFPEDRREAKRLQIDNAFTHDLERLLTLTDQERIIRSEVPEVDFDAAFDWEVERRYTPVGTKSTDEVFKQIEATERVCQKLFLYELIEKLTDIEIEAAEVRGPFNFFALCRSTSFPWWELVIAFWSLDEIEQSDREEYLDNLLTDRLNPVLQRQIGGLRFLPPESPELTPYYDQTRMLVGPVQHARNFMMSNNLINGIALPRCFIVTCANFEVNSVRDRIREIASGASLIQEGQRDE